MTTRLEQIVDVHRAAAVRDERELTDLMALVIHTGPVRDFTAALSMNGLSAIAEVKRRSPSAGDLDADLDPAALSRQYESGGASCLSVLTDVQFFGGSVGDLRAARHAVDLPILRKDFTVDPRDVVDARLMGADAILLIVAVLDDDELVRFAELARRLRLDVLFEVHDELEIARAVDAGATIIGVNQRNLHTFEIDTTLAVRLRDRLPSGVIAVAESGIRDVDDARRIADAGYDAMLVGSSLVTASSPADAVRQLVGVND